MELWEEIQTALNGVIVGKCLTCSYIIEHDMHIKFTLKVRDVATSGKACTGCWTIGIALDLKKYFNFVLCFTHHFSFWPDCSPPPLIYSKCAYPDNNQRFAEVWPTNVLLAHC